MDHSAGVALMWQLTGAHEPLWSLKGAPMFRKHVRDVVAASKVRVDRGCCQCMHGHRLPLTDERTEVAAKGNEPAAGTLQTLHDSPACKWLPSLLNVHAALKCGGCKMGCGFQAGHMNMPMPLHMPVPSSNG
eukprot:363514-Chlamydomonas_euryale.AAC.1